MPETPTCETCRFWNQGDDEQDDQYGSCRRHPPVINVPLATLFSLQEMALSEDEDEYSTPHWFAIRGVFPLTFCDTSCGEHKPNE